jgi:hypothetical protein
MKDRVHLDELNHDRDCEQGQDEWNHFRETAETEYASGELQDRMLDVVADDPGNAMRIAQAVIEAIDTGNLDGFTDALSMAALEIRDFRSQAEFVIQERTELISS